MNPMVIDYFDVGYAIIQRLKDAVPEIPKVASPLTTEDLKESALPDTSLHVLYAGDEVEEADRVAGERGFVVQKWLVILAVRHAAAQNANAELLLKKAGPLIPKVLQALQGWTPVPYARPMYRGSGAPVAGYTATFAYLPYMFKVRFVS